MSKLCLLSGAETTAKEENRYNKTLEIELRAVSLWDLRVSLIFCLKFIIN